MSLGPFFPLIGDLTRNPEPWCRGRSRAQDLPPTQIGPERKVGPRRQARPRRRCDAEAHDTAGQHLQTSISEHRIGKVGLRGIAHLRGQVGVRAVPECATCGARWSGPTAVAHDFFFGGRRGWALVRMARGLAAHESHQRPWWRGNFFI